MSRGPEIFLISKLWANSPAGDYSGLFVFFDKYGNDENTGLKCMDNSAHDVNLQSLVLLQACKNHLPFEIRSKCSFCSCHDEFWLPTQEHFRQITWIRQNLGRWCINRSSSLQKIAHSTSDYDGVVSYAHFIDIIKLLGKPIKSNLPDIYRLCNFQNSTIWNHLSFHRYSCLLINGIQIVSQDFKSKFNKRTMVSDSRATTGIRVMVRI